MRNLLNRAFCACLLLVLLAVPAGTALRAHGETTAYYENRALAKLPALTWESLWDGSFGAAFESWYSDHVPGRTTLLMADTAVQLDLLDRPVVNGIVVTEEDVLLPFQEYQDWSRESYAAKAADIAADYEKLDRHVAAQGGSLYYIGFPEQRIYFDHRFPDYLNSREEEAAAADEIFLGALTEHGVRVLDMGAVYAAQGDPTEYYSVVDHHYSYYGTYAAYRAVLDALNADGRELPVLTEERIDLVELPNPYIGSRNRKLYNLWEHTEKAVIGVQKEPVAFRRTDNGAPSNAPLFALPADGQLPVTYTMYMGGDFAETVFETDRPELPDALVFGDSFTNAMETLLYASFDQTRVLDLRYYTEQSLREYITEHQPDIVLCIQNDTAYYSTSGNGRVWED